MDVGSTPTISSFYDCKNRLDYGGANPNEAKLYSKGSSANELRLKQFCDWTKSKKQNAELPLNASEQDTPTISTNKKACFKAGFFIGLIGEELNQF